jgi:hypothetical protein
VCSLLSIPLSLTAKVNSGDDGNQKTIRIFLNTGEIINYDASEIDSITVTAEAQCIWQGDVCKSFAIEDIDSIWYMTPTLKLTTKSLDFGKVAVGNSKMLTATLTNTNSTMETYNVLGDNAFSITGSSDEIMILPGESRNIEVTFAPSDSISYSGLLSIVSNAVENGVISLPLVGEGVAADSLEMDVDTPPIDVTFDILLQDEERIEDFEGFKIVNFNGEYPLNIPTMARSIRRARRAEGILNQFSANATISSKGLQLQMFTDPQGHPYMYTYTLPGEKPEFSFIQTGLALLLSMPYLAPADETDYKNTVTLLKKLKSFNTYVYNLRQEYNDALSHNRTPDYSKVSVEAIWGELYDMVRDNRQLRLSGVSLKDLNITPNVANFTLHNDFKRSLAVYASRLKMNESNLIVTDQEEISPTFSDVLIKLTDYLIMLENQELKDKKSEISEMIDLGEFGPDDALIIGASQVMLKELAELSANDPVYQEEVPIWLPYMIDSGKSDYWDIVWDAKWGLYWETYWNSVVGFFTGEGIDKEGVRAYMQSNDASIFAKDEEMSFEFKGFDKIQLDIYGLGIWGKNNWESLTTADKARLFFMLFYGGYFDVVKPLLKTITGFKEVYKQVDANGRNIDFRFTSKDVWIGTLLVKLFYEFRMDPKNWEEFITNIKDGKFDEASIQIGKFALKEMSKLPKEAQETYSKDDENKCTYINLLYHIAKSSFGLKVTSEAFREVFKTCANGILEFCAIVLKTTSACESLMDLSGGVRAIWSSDVKETFIINKYDKPYITLKEPTVTYLTPDVDVHFSWEASMGNAYGWNYVYDLELIIETTSEQIPNVVLRNLEETSCNYNLATLPGASSARKIFCRIIAHHPDDPSQIYVMSDVTQIVQNTSINQVAPPEMVDLGLPSGTKWATCNLGATSYKEIGYYFAWGEKTSKSSYTWKTYNYSGNTSNSLTKYNTKKSYGKIDNKTQLEVTDDKVKSDYGYYYSIPTKEDWEELMKYCEWTRFGDGIRVRGIDAHHSIIYLPLAGYRDGLNVYDDGKEGSYWSSTLDANSPDDAWYVRISNAKPSLDSYYRYQGRCIRPVQHKAKYAAPSTAQ